MSRVDRADPRGSATAALRGRPGGAAGGWASSDQAIRARIGDGRLHRLHRGVFAIGPGPVSLRGRWRAATLAGGPRALLSHLHSAALHDLAKPPRGPVHVTRRRNGGFPVARASSSTRPPPSPPRSSTTVDGIPTTSLARTLLDVAAIGAPSSAAPHVRARRAPGDPRPRCDSTASCGCAEAIAAPRGFEPRRVRPDRGGRTRSPSSSASTSTCCARRGHPGAAGQRARRRLSRRLLLAGGRPRRRARQLRVPRRPRGVRARPREDRRPAAAGPRGGPVHLPAGDREPELGASPRRELSGRRSTP